MNWSEIFKQKYPKFRKYAFTFTKDMAAADDLVMEVLSRLIEKHNSGNLLIDDAEALIIRSIRNLYIDTFRASRKMSSLDDGDVIEGAYESSQPTPDLTDGLLDLAKNLDKLGERCRDILSLFGLGYSYKEIAKIEEIQIGNVMARMSRCRSSLAEFYDQRS